MATWPLLTPAAAAEVVCHDEQLTVWSGDLAGALSLGGFLREDLDYDQVIDLHETLQREIRSFIDAAFGHPSLRMSCSRRV